MNILPPLLLPVSEASLVHKLVLMSSNYLLKFPVQKDLRSLICVCVIHLPSMCESMTPSSPTDSTADHVLTAKQKVL